MARKVAWIAQLDDATRTALERAVDAAPRETAESLYGRFGIAQRGVPRRTFGHWVQMRRKANRERANETPGDAGDLDGMSDPQLYATLRRRLLVGALNSLNAGDPKLYELVSLLARVQEYDRQKVVKSAERRAAELHELKVKQLSKELRNAVDELTGQGEKSASREAIFDKIDAIMRSV